MKSRIKDFLVSLSTIFPKAQILNDELSRHAYAHDASQYLLIPDVIVIVESELEVIQVLDAAKKFEVPLTFRAAGTSLSGQALSNSILVVLGQNWREYTILDDGARIRLQPGIIGSEVNLFLAPYQRKIGPDPASIASAKIGGIVANNASGMCCGISQNSYHTVLGMRIIFNDGTLLDTEDEDSCRDFSIKHRDFLTELSTIRQSILEDSELRQLIQNQYRIKNTLGYSLNSFLDFEDPIEILMHLMIGSEGTLGFIASVTYQTVPAFTYEAAALLFFDKIESACEAALLLPRHEIAAMELMDEASFKASKMGIEAGKTGLLIDIKAETAALLEFKIQKLTSQMQTLAGLLEDAKFISDRTEYHKIWAIRRGIFPAVAGTRKQGSSLINEDVAVSPQDLPNFCKDLQALFNKYGYTKTCIFGHVKDGNLHFLLEADFETPAGIAVYDHLMQDLTHLIVERYQGALKAEHGTGRNMAPFVEKAWGNKAYRIMERLKTLFDPDCLLNPDVILSQNQRLHIEALKTYPLVDPLIDRCIECGFCEKVCPSRKLTLTPRQRIVALRTMKLLAKEFDVFQYRGIETCAATGLCKTVCPVGINTGDIVRKQRYLYKSKLNHRAIRFWIKHFALVMRVMKWILKPIAFIRFSPLPCDRINTLQNPIQSELKPIYYFPSCSARLFKNDQAVLQSILEKLGYTLIQLPNYQPQCCGLMFNSKGYLKEAHGKMASLEKFLKTETNGAPVLCEMGSCVLQMTQFFKESIPVYEAIEFVADQLQDYPLRQLDETVMLHVTCSIERLGLREKLVSLAKRCATQVIIPPDITCCGFAGEKGFTTPELNQSALSTLRSQVPANCQQGYSMSLTCEIGLTKASGISYRSLLYLIQQAL